MGVLGTSRANRYLFNLISVRFMDLVTGDQAIRWDSDCGDSEFQVSCQSSLQSLCEVTQQIGDASDDLLAGYGYFETAFARTCIGFQFQQGWARHHRGFADCLLVLGQGSAEAFQEG